MDGFSKILFSCLPSVHISSFLFISYLISWGLGSGRSDSTALLAELAQEEGEAEKEEEEEEEDGPVHNARRARPLGMSFSSPSFVPRTDRPPKNKDFLSGGFLRLQGYGENPP